MGIASLTLGITGLFTWIFPFLGVPISLAGLILGALAFWRSEKHRKLALTGLITCVVGLVLNVMIVVVGITMLGMLESFYEMFPGYFHAYY